MESEGTSERGEDVQKRLFSSVRMRRCRSLANASVPLAAVQRQLLIPLSRRMRLTRVACHVRPRVRPSGVEQCRVGGCLVSCSTLESS